MGIFAMETNESTPLLRDNTDNASDYSTNNSDQQGKYKDARRKELSRKQMLIIALFGFFGFLFLSSGIALVFTFRIILEKLIKEHVVLSPSSDVYEFWKEPPIPIRVHFYFFNITNKEDFPWINVEPHVTEVGPYTFSEKWRKIDIDWHANGTVSYKQIKTYEFEPKLSNGSEFDRINTVNIPLLTAAFMFKTANPLVKLALTSAFHFLHEYFVIERSIRELLFEGYNDPLIKAAREIFGTYPYTKFGYFFGKNGTDDGVYTVHTGIGDSEQFTKIDRWNGESSLPWWKSNYCNMINGTDGSSFPPFLKSSKNLEIYSTDLCRSIALEYAESFEVFDIPVYRFHPIKNLLDSGNVNNENQCFCTEKCLPSGVYNISQCKFGAPLFVSYPHFLNADRWYFDNVKGLKPNESLHQSFFDVEPITGSPVRLAARFQINAFVQSIEGLSFFESLKEMLFPLLWFSQTAEVDGPVINKLISSTQKPYYYSRVISFALMGLGMTLLVVGIVYLVITRKEDKEKLAHSESCTS